MVSFFASSWPNATRLFARYTIDASAACK
jgi:hypothetical protein